MLCLLFSFSITINHKQYNMISKYNFTTQNLTITHQQNYNTDLNKLYKNTIEILSPNVTKMLPNGWQNISNLKLAEQWVKERSLESTFLTIQEIENKKLIGFLFLYPTNKNNYHFGYLLSEKHWGKGYGTELIKGLLIWCKTQVEIKTLIGGVDQNNIGSIKVLEKNGFVTKNKNTDTILFYEYCFIPKK